MATEHLDEAHAVALAMWRTRFPLGYLEPDSEPVEVIRKALAEARAPEHGGEMREFLLWLYEKLGPELNLSNYSHEDVCELNDNVVEAVLAIRALLARESAEPAEERK